MNILSVFDGISCGRVALERAGIPISQYHACEIDKYAIKISEKNYPDIIRHGSVVGYHPDRWFDWLIGGSPCQGFSSAGLGKAFNDPRSMLFWEFIRILGECKAINPNIKFLLENVKMKKCHLDVISSVLGVEPICINSALVSAQNRVRYYWCNWSVSQPEDRGIFLRDIVQNEGEFDSHIGNDVAMARAARKNYSKPRIMPDKTGTLNTKNNSGQLAFDSGTTLVPYLLTESHTNRLLNSTDVPKGFSRIDPDKAGCLTARTYANYKGTFVTVDREKSLTLLASYADRAATSSESDIKRYNEMGINQIVKVEHGESGQIIYRKLTPIECERLQTLPDNYTDGGGIQFTALQGARQRLERRNYRTYYAGV